jgi:hypothetical protein
LLIHFNFIWWPTVNTFGLHIVTVGRKRFHDKFMQLLCVVRLNYKQKHIMV